MALTSLSPGMLGSLVPRGRARRCGVGSQVWWVLFCSLLAPSSPEGHGLSRGAGFHTEQKRVCVLCVCMCVSECVYVRVCTRVCVRGISAVLLYVYSLHVCSPQAQDIPAERKDNHEMTPHFLQSQTPDNWRLSPWNCCKLLQAVH